MKITEISIENYKGFRGQHNYVLNGNLVFLVGENNTGKSTFMEAVDFLVSGLDKRSISDVLNKSADSNSVLSVTATLSGNLRDLITNFSEDKYLPYVYEVDGVETLKLQRSSEERTISQNGKNVSLDISKLTVWNNEANQYENPAGFDKAFKSFFDPQFIWSDVNPEDVTDFGSTKICGRLFKEIFSTFQQQTEWGVFEQQHQAVFGSLKTQAETLTNEVADIFRSQYGDARISFDFPMPDPSNYLKSAGIVVDDGVSTPLFDKGSGMQRGLALAFMQLYAKRNAAHPSNPELIKPLCFFIDEPEVSLHPKAQYKLLEALVTISETQQVFITTHSPLVLKKFNSLNHNLLVFTKSTAGEIAVTSASQLNLFGASSPTWGEVMYRAFDFPTIELHNELFAKLQGQDSQPQLETRFIARGHAQSQNATHSGNGTPIQETLMTYIRNRFHHPENTSRNDPSDTELRQSINNMIDMVQNP